MERGFDAPAAVGVACAIMGDMQSIHFIGIGGVGMSALAQAFLDKGWRVGGSDRLLGQGQETPVLAVLRRQGVRLFPQDGTGVAEGPDVVVYSTAIEADNPDLAAARARGVKVLHRSEALAELARGHELIAVTGTCGKSSVTALLGHLLSACGRDPFVVNGAEVVGWDAAGARVGSVRPSASADGLMVTEADESDKSLMALSPAHVIVTNAFSDHFPKAEAEGLFRAFKAKATGIVLDTSGAPPEPPPAGEGWEARFQWEGRAWRLPMPGAHNVANAKVALKVALQLGCDAETLRRALADFPGVRRRLERTGKCRGATVVDDYAHNVEKLAAAWATLAAAFPQGVFGVWRPHGYAPLRKMLEGLAGMFNAVVRPCDRLLLLPVYDAGGTADRSVRSEDLLARLTCPAEGVGTLEAAAERLRALARPGTALAFFGARDPGLNAWARRLGQEG